MKKIRINKIDAARRQLDAAIRMTFDDEDPIAIHTVTAAAHRIIRDLCERRGDIEEYLRFRDWINPDHEREFWSYWNAAASFMKHADKDPEAIHELEEEHSDFLVLISAKWYRELGYAPTPEMIVFGSWFAYGHPEILKADPLSRAGITSEFATVAQMMKTFRVRAD